MPRGFVARTIVLVALVAVPVLGMALEIDWFTVDGGGGTSTGGGFSLTGAVGQPDAGSMGSGTLELRGGFLPAAGATATGVEEVITAAVPAVYGLSATAPNPFRARTSVNFELPRAAHAKIRVFDVTGRLVSTLVDEPLTAGRHEAVWDGRDRSGRRAASGVYFLRMQAENFGATRKVMRLD